ncbi:MAG TPA: di-heme oxidoredictase family protein [Candidatus Angelobacter sp.]|nr:di-heme oxidoredictase family protein [Candidatus Angelobacter sp.]
MFNKERISNRSIPAVLVIFTLLFMVNVLQAQTPAASASDPGPRPTGREALNADPNAVCPVTGTKFPGTVCLDFVQPPAVSPAPVADGAGNIVANAGNLGGTWFEALTVFSTPASVDGTNSAGAAGQFIKGLGPSFNGESCFQCHSQPAVGGSSPGCVGTFCSNMTANPTTGAVTSKFSASNNPQVVDATDRGGVNSIPSFINQANGPLLEVRFPKAVGAGPSTLGNPASVPAGAVAELFVISGRSDAPANCTIDQEDFQAQQAANNVVFRIPIPTFGDGFVENTPETSLAAAANAAKAEAGTTFGAISFGVFNLSGNDQTITRFGWKAQNKSLLMFAGEASNVEMGVTNELFPTERTYGNAPNCTPNQLPEDVTQSLNSTQIENITGPLPTSPVVDEAGVTSVISSNIENDSIFMRLNGAPSICNFNSGVSSTTGLAVCKPVDQSVERGAALFGNSVLPAPAGTAPATVGCVFCHWQTFTTGPSTTPTLNNATFHPFSDFGLHHMGGLADGVKQGSAGVDQFRTAPLWGLGQRLFFLHDGRANDLLTAIADHCLPVASGSTSPASEACTVISNFNALPPTCTNSTCTSSTGVVGSQQDLLNFLRSL